MRIRWTANREYKDWNLYCDSVLARIIATVAQMYSIDPTWIVSDRRGRGLAEPRAIAMYLARVHTEASFPVIGAAFGGKHHTTVIAARDKVERRMEELGAVIEEAEARLAPYL